MSCRLLASSLGRSDPIGGLPSERLLYPGMSKTTHITENLGPTKPLHGDVGRSSALADMLGPFMILGLFPILEVILAKDIDPMKAPGWLAINFS